MSTVPLTSYFSLKNATMQIDADNFEDAITSVNFSPSTSASTVRTINSNVLREQNTAEWGCEIGLVQDLAPAGLLRYLLDHEGERKDVKFVPVVDGPTIEAKLIISPAGIGGANDGTPATGSVTLAVVGKPTFVDPA
ncbi:hypothetical protein [Xylanimonas ulmi]|uniref:Uncharacterized protein n=1 Tax=Xylanimonas ulmi TaxID=228973 RepID=A0A4Q7M212_9MICO|nr:hypothetical protein [Xylanibacterium ulmi]RZS60458.1 hypothetical protein EV386_0716 [Xylanibacterium ulmi]